MEAELIRNVEDFIEVCNSVEIENEAAKRLRVRLEQSIVDLNKEIDEEREAIDIVTHAIEILQGISDDSVKQAYEYLEGSINGALERMFVESKRKIKIREFLRNNKYPQLEIDLFIDGDEEEPISLKTDSGHGIAQIVSILSILCLIVLTGKRRILIIDEVLSGLSVHNRKIITDILWAFTDIGFQFIVNEHGFIPRGSKVYQLEQVGKKSGVAKTYIAEQGVYLQGTEEENYDYSQVLSGVGVEIREGEEFLGNVKKNVDKKATSEYNKEKEVEEEGKAEEEAYPDLIVI